MKPSSDASERDSLRDYEVLVCVAGGIAAYKVCEFVSQLAQRGAGVTVAMTESACRLPNGSTGRIAIERTSDEEWVAICVSVLTEAESPG